MTDEWSVPAWAFLATLGVLLVAAMLTSVATARSRRRATTALELAHADVEALKAQVDAIERRLAHPAPRVDEHEYVITRLGDEPEGVIEPAAAVPAPLFADLVLREGVVQAASVAAGLRRALSPETRMRIRIEMRREVKRARKQRRADTRRARREYDARRRGQADAA